MAVPPLEALPGSRYAVLADAHIHPGQTPPFPERLAAALADVDGILTLGDMGDATGLDTLGAHAPVRGVLGADNPNDDPRVPAELRLFSIGGVTLGAVFDGVKHGFLSANDPVAVQPELPELLGAAFGRRPDVLLHAASHKASVTWAAGTLLLNPGGPTLAGIRTLAVLHIEHGCARVEQVVFQA